jgi:peptidoglycan-N-acetylmuramic acid deacetylase
MKINAMLAVVLTAAAFSSIVRAVAPSAVTEKRDTDRYSWYCKNNDSHTPPVLPSEFSFITENGGYYLDDTATDEQKVIYLTFDAGYENGNVEKILDVLKKHKAPGAFFVLGNLITKNTDLVKRMVEEGHLVCNHTNRHNDMSRVTDEEKFQNELNALNEIMKECCGTELAPFYRPPEGKFSQRNLKCAAAMGYRTIFWSYAYADWDNHKQMSEEKALNKLLTHTHNGEVLLLHPTSATNAAILDTYLTRLEEEGYAFRTLYDLTAKG